MGWNEGWGVKNGWSHRRFRSYGDAVAGWVKSGRRSKKTVGRCEGVDVKALNGRKQVGCGVC